MEGEPTETIGQCDGVAVASYDICRKAGELAIRCFAAGVVNGFKNDFCNPLMPREGTHRRAIIGAAPSVATSSGWDDGNACAAIGVSIIFNQNIQRALTDRVRPHQGADAV